MIRGIHHIAVSTANFDRLYRFYADVLGFVAADEEMSWRNNPKIDRAIGLEGSAARTRMLRAGTCYLELFQYEAPSAVAARPLRPCDKGYTHIALDVDDIQSEHRRLVAAGMEFVDDRLGDFGEIITLYGKDPDGNIIEIQQTRPGHALSLANLPALSSKA